MSGRFWILSVSINGLISKNNPLLFMDLLASLSYPERYLFKWIVCKEAIYEVL